MANIIVELFENSGMSIREFATAADLKYSTAHDIVTGKANIENIGAGAFVRIAHVFGTTADALIYGIQEQDGKSDLSVDERELIDAYRSMSQSDREILLNTARRFAAFAGDGEESCRLSAGIALTRVEE